MHGSNTGPEPMARMSWSSLRKPLRNALGIALVAASGIYIYRILADSIDQLRSAAYLITGSDWAWLTLGTLGTLVLSTLYHVLATRRIEPGIVPATKIGLAYALGQIVRYLPGKILGVLYQVKLLSGKLRASTITLALIVQTIYDYLWTFAFAGTILLCATSRNAWPLAVLLPVGIGIWWTHAHGWCERALLLPGPVQRLLSEVPLDHLRSPKHSVRSTLILIGEWIPMLLGIGIALHGTLGLADAMVLGAVYLLAAVSSLLIIVVPSGLVVREAVFVWLGSRYGFEPAMLLFLGLILRVALTFAEALNVVVFLAADAFRSRLGSKRILPD